MRCLNGDTFWNRWPSPVLPSSGLALAPAKVEESIFAGQEKEDRDGDADLGEEDAEAHFGTELPEGQTVPFPHEHHGLLCQAGDCFACQSYPQV